MWGAEAGGRDDEAFRSGLQSHAWGPKVEADLAQAKRLGVVGTPWFFINGVRLVGAQPLEAFQSVISQQIIAAHAKIATGTPPGRVYAEVSKENVAAQPAEHDDDEADPEDDAKTVFRVPVGQDPGRGGSGTA